uniref:Transposase n=1 Tax=Fervidicoccus fontis TaxID=683846 RepID=A0A7J3SKD3_9CREN
MKTRKGIRVADLCHLCRGSLHQGHLPCPIGPPGEQAQGPKCYPIIYVDETFLKVRGRDSGRGGGLS